MTSVMKGSKLSKPKWEGKTFTAQEQAKIVDKLVTARVGLLLRHPFFGNLATRMKMIEASDWCQTLATDGRNFYYNTGFVNELSPKECEFGFAHEVLHNIFDHMGRREGRDPKLANIAADYAANQILKDEKIGTVPSWIKIFQDDKYRGKSYEEIYAILYAGAEKIHPEDLGELLDDHLDDEDDDGGGDCEDGDKPGKGKRPRLSKAERQQIRDEIKEAMIAAAQSAGAGKVPAGIQRMIKDLTEPKMDWRQLLRQQIQSTIRSDYTFSRPNRKGWHTGVVLPGMNFAETIDICIALDMSGSIGNDQASDFLGEIKGIMDEYKDYQIKLWCFDTKVYNEQDFSADCGEDLTEYKLKGGGGTDFMCNWTYMKNHGIQPKKFIMFTDGYAWNSWGDPEYCDTIFIIHQNHDKSLEGPFGITAHYEKTA